MVRAPWRYKRYRCSSQYPATALARGAGSVTGARMRMGFTDSKETARPHFRAASGWRVSPRRRPPPFSSRSGSGAASPRPLPVYLARNLRGLGQASDQIFDSRHRAETATSKAILHRPSLASSGASCRLLPRSVLSFRYTSGFTGSLFCRSGCFSPARRSN
jgi:hypothetical protein